MICMICIMSDSDSDNNNGNYFVEYSFGSLLENKTWNETKSFNNEDDAMEYARNLEDEGEVGRWGLLGVSVMDEDYDTIWNMGDDKYIEQQNLETEVEELREKVKQLTEENKQLKLQLEKQTLSNVLDKKFP